MNFSYDAVISNFEDNEEVSKYHTYVVVVLALFEMRVKLKLKLK